MFDITVYQHNRILLYYGEMKYRQMSKHVTNATAYTHTYHSILYERSMIGKYVEKNRVEEPED